MARASVARAHAPDSQFFITPAQVSSTEPGHSRARRVVGASRSVHTGKGAFHQWGAVAVAVLGPAERTPALLSAEPRSHTHAVSVAAASASSRMCPLLANLCVQTNRMWAPCPRGRCLALPALIFAPCAHARTYLRDPTAPPCRVKSLIRNHTHARGVAALCWRASPLSRPSSPLHCGPVQQARAPCTSTFAQQALVSLNAESHMQRPHALAATAASASCAAAFSTGVAASQWRCAGAPCSTPLPPAEWM